MGGKRRKGRRGAWLLALELAAVALLTGLLCRQGRDRLSGVWDCDGYTAYRFDGRGRGALLLSDSEYEFTYRLEGDWLFIDFADEAARDGAYTLSLEGDRLRLTGGEGTFGGNFELRRTEKQAVSRGPEG